MANNTYATMDRVGYVNTNSSKAERILADYIGTNKSQSNIFRGQIKSLIAAVQNNPNNPSGVASQVQSELNDLFNAYMDNVLVETQANLMTDATDQKVAGLYEIEIYIQYTEGGIVVQVAKTLQYDNTGLTRLITLER